MPKIKAGVISANSEKINQDAFQWLFQNAIDLSYESFLQNLEAQGLSEDEIEIERDSYMSDNSTYLLGDWKRLENGQFVPDIKDYADNFSAIFDSNNNIIVIEYSKQTAECHHTSPCYSMRDRSPCGDLDTPGNSVEAYTLPQNIMN